MPPTELWILDGHNLLLWAPGLRDLVDTRHEEARNRLRIRAEGFAARRGARVLVVFDGREGLGGGESRGLVEVVYARSTEADDRIAHRADQAVRSGDRVHVVTDDNGLRRRLHDNVHPVDRAMFWKLSAATPDQAAPEKPGVTDPDITAHFLARDGDPVDAPNPVRRRAQGDAAYRQAAAEGRTGGEDGAGTRGDPPQGADRSDPGAGRGAGRGAAGSRAGGRTSGSGPTGGRTGPSIRGSSPPPRDPSTPTRPVLDRPPARPEPDPVPVDPAERLAAKKERGRRKQERRLAQGGRGKRKKKRKR